MAELGNPGEGQDPPTNGASPPPCAKQESSKSLLEVLITPLTLALITVIAGYCTNHINNQNQANEAERARRASQLDAVIKLMPATTVGDAAAYAPRLAAYGEASVPLLAAALGFQSKPDQISALERNLIQVGVISRASEAVGKAMALILEDRWKLYDHPIHEAAMKVISAVCYGRAREILASYDPEHVVRDWQDVLSVSTWKTEFDDVRAAAKQVADKCTAQPRPEPPIGAATTQLEGQP